MPTSLLWKNAVWFAGQGAPVVPSALTITSDNYRVATTPAAVELAAWSDTLGANETVTVEYDNDGTFASPTEVTGITESPYAPALTDLALYYARFKKVNSETGLESDWSSTQQVYVADLCHIFAFANRGAYQDLSKTVRADEVTEPALKLANEGDLGANGDIFQDSGVLADAPIVMYDTAGADDERVALAFDAFQKWYKTATFTAQDSTAHWVIFIFADITSEGTNNTKLYHLNSGTGSKIAIRSATTSATTHGMRNELNGSAVGANQSQNTNVFAENVPHAIAQLLDGTNFYAYIDNFTQYDTAAYSTSLSVNNVLFGRSSAGDTNNMPDKVLAFAWGTDTMTAVQLQALYDMMCEASGVPTLKGA